MATTAPVTADVAARYEPFIFRISPMRPLFFPAMAIATLTLTGCASAPNDPTLTLQTHKTPAQYAECVVPKLQGSALHPTVSQTQRSYRIVVPSKVAADNVLEAYKAQGGGKVFLYERHLLASSFVPSSFERAAQECL
jgi:ABC-type uncharacterized transport system auxiliary subunit